MGDNGEYPAPKRALKIIKGTATFGERFVPNHEELIELLRVLRDMNCTIVFVTGVWDLFHIGHAKYIELGKERARKLYPESDQILMVVGVETDALTKIRKGPDRPIVPEEERVEVLSHLRAVDILTLQSEPDQLYRIVDHDVRVISVSTTDLPALEEIQRYCKHVVNLPPQAETSTTARVRRLSMDGAGKVLGSIQKGLERLLGEVRDEITSGR